MSDIVIIGGGGHAKVVISVIKKRKHFNIIGYTDPADHGEILGANYLGNDDVLKNVKKDFPFASAVVCIGMLTNSDAIKRKQLFGLAQSCGFNMPHLISPDAIVNENVEFGSGTIVLDAAVVNSGTVIGEAVIANTNCSIDHDCKIGNFSHIAPGATLSGGVTVGENVMIGIGSTVVEWKSIADNIIIGAGSVVTKDCDEVGTYVGIPAKKIS